MKAATALWLGTQRHLCRSLVAAHQTMRRQAAALMEAHTQVTHRHNCFERMPLNCTQQQGAAGRMRRQFLLLEAVMACLMAIITTPLLSAPCQGGLGVPSGCPLPVAPLASRSAPKIIPLAQFISTTLLRHF
jgi:hypothetical protein